MFTPSPPIANGLGAEFARTHSNSALLDPSSSGYTRFGMRSPALASTFLLALSIFAPACNGADGSRIAAILELEGDASTGAGLFSSNCSTCHGADAGGSNGPSIAGLPQDVIVEATLSGPGPMPNFSDLENQELADISTFVSGL